MKLPLLLITLLLGCNPTQPPHVNAGDISILAWNLESGGNDPAVIAHQLRSMPGYDVYALSEVSPKNFSRYQEAIGLGFGSVESVTGGGDRLQLIFNERRFELVREQEMDRYRDYLLNNGNHRSPLLIHLKERSSGIEFQVMVNHLARGNEDLRTQQAIGLREWARDQTLPTIAIGDFNMDYDFPTSQGNEAFVEMLRDNVWQWVKPAELIDTNWADPDGDGLDNYPDSMLDFAFVAGPAREWKPVSNVIVRDGDFPDDETESDHRPIELILDGR